MSKIMDAWRAWSQRLYDRHGSKLQAKYDKIAGIELSPEMKKILDSLSKLISPDVVLRILKFVKETYANVPGTTEGVIEKVLEKIKKVL